MMRPQDPTYDTLRRVHIEVLTGSLIDGAERGPGEAGYAWSRGIADPTMNFAYGVRTPEQFAWAGAAALGRGRAPAFLAQDDGEVADLQRLFAPASIFPASWMIAKPLPAATGADESVSVRSAPSPGADFERVFASMTADAAVRMHLQRTYLPALRRARGRPGLVPLHLTLRDATGPAACASLYLRGEAAGLYNVSTRIDRQRRGLGLAIVHAALREARARGAAYVFLQCPAGGAIEALYARAGFRTVHSPTLLCTSLMG